MSLWRCPILLVLVAGVGVHACVVMGVRHRAGSIDGYAFNSLDCGEYYAIARNVVAHGAFSQSDAPPLKPDTWRTPGYPLFLAAFILLFGESPAMLIVVQQVLSIVNVLLLFLIARRWMHERRAAIVALLFLIEPYHLLYSAWLMGATLFVTVLLLTWHAWQRAIEHKGWWWYAVTGLLAGALVLIRPVGVLIPLAIFVGFIGSRWRSGSRGGSSGRKGMRATAWLGLGVFAASCLVVVGSWMLRNKVVAGRFAISDQGGVVLAYFKATEVVLWREGRTADRYLETSLNPDKANQPHTVWDGIDRRLQYELAGITDEQRATLTWGNLAQGNKTTVDSFEISGALGRIGRSYLLESPLSTAGCCLARCGAILTFPLNLAITPPAGIESSRWRSLAMGTVYSLLILGVLIRVVRRRLVFQELYFPLAGLIALLLTTTPQVDPRFRVPMIPLLLVIALLPGAGADRRQGRNNVASQDGAGYGASREASSSGAGSSPAAGSPPGESSPCSGR